jgi:SAM-dependent methyltransferase
MPIQPFPPSERPEPFSVYTTPEFWNDPHISERMLHHHLDSSTYFSSRPHDFIDRSVEWMVTRFKIGAGSRVLDLGCGPGLYAERLARRGAAVIGIDASHRSIDYAREVASREGLAAEYIAGSYLDIPLPADIDLALLIYRDLCALGPDQRQALLGAVRTSLADGGSLVFDVQGASGFEDTKEEVIEAENLHDGFFAPAPYLGRMERFRYPDERLVLERYTITDADGTREFYNWNQFLSPADIEVELGAAGFDTVEFLGSVAGDPFDPEWWEFAVAAS